MALAQITYRKLNFHTKLSKAWSLRPFCSVRSSGSSVPASFLNPQSNRKRNWHCTWNLHRPCLNYAKDNCWDPENHLQAKRKFTSRKSLWRHRLVGKPVKYEHETAGEKKDKEQKTIPDKQNRLPLQFEVGTFPVFVVCFLSLLRVASSNRTSRKCLRRLLTGSKNEITQGVFNRM